MIYDQQKWNYRNKVENGRIPSRNQELSGENHKQTPRDQAGDQSSQRGERHSLGLSDVLGLVELAPPWRSAYASSSAGIERERERGARGR